jgi:hypothetical protein
VGTLDGKAVGVSESPAPGGFFQVPSGSLTIPIVPTFSGQDAGTDPTMLYVQLNWGGLVADGASAAATGTLTLPAGQPLGGMALCAGAGTSISPASDGSLAFEFAGLTLAPGCTQAVTGSLAGCWNPSN